MQPADPSLDIGAGGAVGPCTGHIADKAHLYVGAGEPVADQEIPARKASVDEAQVVGDLGLDARVPEIGKTPCKTARSVISTPNTQHPACGIQN